MTINQISIFLENKFGRLSEVLSILRHENIRVIAATVADTSDYGILRIITTDQQKAYLTLLENKVSVNMNEVLAISMDSKLVSCRKLLKNLLNRVLPLSICIVFRSIRNQFSCFVPTI